MLWEIGWLLKNLMKREAVSSSKMKKLCKILGLKVYMAVGILEGLWHLTAREAPQGDIGKLSNDDIALSLDYEHDPEILIRALIEARWIDQSKEHRLVVHDWHEHADDSVKKRLIRNKRPFLSNHVSPLAGHVAPLTRHVQTTAENGSLPVPVPEPEPEPEPEPGAVPEQDAPPTFTPPLPMADPDSGGELILAAWMLEESGIPADRDLLRISAECIRLQAREGGTLREAAGYIAHQAKEARSRGDTVNRFWFSDQRYRPQAVPMSRKQRQLEAAAASFSSE